MIVLIDTTLWSLALRRRPTDLSALERTLFEEWSRLVRTGEAALAGPIRQEILSGIRADKVCRGLQRNLSAFRYLEIEPPDYDRAAAFFNVCRSRGIAGGAIDLLLCAVASRNEVPIFTTDPNFTHYARHLPIRLHTAPDRR